MSNNSFMSSDDIRHEFSMAMSAMYQAEVPLYGDLVDLVSKVNAEVLATQPEIKSQLLHTGEIERLNMERHGAIRLGTASELSMMRRLFAVMGMYPVGYYDLAPAGVPVHSTAFRTLDSHSLHKSPFRVFTSLLRLDLIGDVALEREAIKTLQKRCIFTDDVIELIERFEVQEGLIPEDARHFIKEALETFRWHDKTPVTKELYQKLLHQHPLIADVVGFKGPHINHLTPRTLDIDAAQQKMQTGGIPSKAIIEGPPRRACPILLRQTSFKALEESVSFRNAYIGDSDECCDGYEQGSHTARFGEVEQRGVALTPKGRALYDTLLNEARNRLGVTPNEDNASQYYQILDDTFSKFPDNYRTLHDADLAYFYYQLTDNTHDSGQAQALLSAAFHKVDLNTISRAELSTLIDDGVIRIEPIMYEDFLPVSAAGIFQSNLNQSKNNSYEINSSQQDFEQALGTTVYDELKLYEEIQAQSLQQCLAV
ncbi:MULTISPECIES: 2-oxoadipate dioxygenase/decarboxylase HglS [unclassified Psychrobacter]|uniref:2-oxoadipate dioxygenase/decarboxylase HglS n=1 Tax=unclassified Psychrobacter TaxID=196806 RepID=UPI003FD5C495